MGPDRSSSDATQLRQPTSALRPAAGVPSWLGAALLLTSLLLPLPGCEQRVVVAEIKRAGEDPAPVTPDAGEGDGQVPSPLRDAGGQASDGGATGDAGEGGGQDGGGGTPPVMAPACDGPMLSLPIGDGPGARCQDGPRKTFRFGICTCGDLVSRERVVVDAFDVVGGQMVDVAPGGSMGINGQVHPTAVNVGGSLWIAHQETTTLIGDLTVGRDLRTGGPVSALGATLTVEGDAAIGGDLSVGQITTGGSLIQPEGASLTISTVAPSGTERPVPVTGTDFQNTPCDCSNSNQVLSTIVSLLPETASSTLNSDALLAETGPVDLQLPCGTHLVSRVVAQHDITIRVQGRTRLIVSGDIYTVAGTTLKVVLENDLAQLDLFVQGSLTTGGNLALGDWDKPGGVRLFSATPGTLDLSGNVLVGGLLFAPDAELVISAPAEIYGALFVERIAASALLRVRQDLRLSEDPGCSPASCEVSTPDCGTRTCGDTQCLPCSGSQACGSWLDCWAGACVP